MTQDLLCLSGKLQLKCCTNYRNNVEEICSIVPLMNLSSLGFKNKLHSLLTSKAIYTVLLTHLVPLLHQNRLKAKAGWKSSLIRKNSLYTYRNFILHCLMTTKNKSSYLVILLFFSFHFPFSSVSPIRQDIRAQGRKKFLF